MTRALFRAKRLVEAGIVARELLPKGRRRVAVDADVQSAFSTRHALGLYLVETSPCSK